jgi:hypothetical protein
MGRVQSGTVAMSFSSSPIFKVAFVTYSPFPSIALNDAVTGPCGAVELVARVDDNVMAKAATLAMTTTPMITNAAVPTAFRFSCKVLIVPSFSSRTEFGQ